MRKDYLRELINIKEAYNQGYKVDEVLKAEYFDVTAGFDENVVETLNIKIKDVTKKYNL